MDTKDFLQLFKKRKTTVISITLIFVIIGLIVTLLQPLKYSSKSRLLILQQNASSDAYTVSKSNEYVGGLISEVIYSGSFLDSLKASNSIFDRNYFSGSYKENVKKWGETVFARSSGSTGVIDIEIYHTNPEEAKNISNAVNQLIISGQSPYKFNPEQTKISIIDEPVVSSFPVKPNIPVNLALSLLFGLIASCSYIYLFPKERVSEKLAKEIFGNQEPIIKQNIQETVPAFEPVMTTQTYNQKVVPENLPIFSVLEDAPIMEEPEFETPYQFQGNISNVLGE
jgi:Capsular polysaccharide biosynthesis protein